MSSWSAWTFWITGSIAIVAGLVIGPWSLFWERSRGRRRCPRCWYDLSGAAPDSTSRYACSECGRAGISERQLHGTRRRWLWTAAAMACLIGGAWAIVWPRVRSDGWLSLLPTRVLLWAAFSESFSSNEPIRHELMYG